MLQYLLAQREEEGEWNVKVTCVQTLRGESVVWRFNPALMGDEPVSESLVTVKKTKMITIISTENIQKAPEHNHFTSWILKSSNAINLMLLHCYYT